MSYHDASLMNHRLPLNKGKGLQDVCPATFCKVDQRDNKRRNSYIILSNGYIHGLENRMER